MATARVMKDARSKCHSLYLICTRNKKLPDPRQLHKTFKFLNEFVPESKEYLSEEHMNHLMGMTEVEDPIPPQLPKQMKQKSIEELSLYDEPTQIEYLQKFPEYSILSPSQPRFVELHLHLEGTMNMNTLWDLYQIKKNTNNSDIISFENIQDLLSYIQSPIQSDITDHDLFYEKHKFLCEILRGNYDGIERIAYELCKRQYKNKIYYTEIRFNPYLLCESFDNNISNAIALNEFDEIITIENDTLKNNLNTELEYVIESVIKGLQRGCTEYNIQINPILQCLRYRPDLNDKIINLAYKYRDLKNNKCHIVGIDLFGGHEIRYHSRLHFHAFKKAKKFGLGRTVHCSDAFDSNGLGILNTIHQLSPERISYCIASRMPKHILHRIFQRQVHLELSIQSNQFQFPFIYDNELYKDEYNMKEFICWMCTNSANYSLSTDFPILLDNNSDMTYLNEINRCMIEYNISEWEIGQSVLNAARASFLNEIDKNILLLTLRERWKSIAPNVDETNFYEDYQDETWDNSDLLQLNLLTSAQS
eukprot:541045_1